MNRKVIDIIPPHQRVIQETSSPKKKEKKKRKIFPFLILGLLLFGVYYFFAFRVDVEIFPVTHGIKAEETFVIKPSGNENLHGSIFETEVLKRDSTFKSSGSFFEESKATGEVTLFNAHSSEPIPIIAQTRLVSGAGDGKVFYLSDRVTIPGRRTDGRDIIPGEIQAEIVASEAGDEYNIGPTTFSLPGLGVGTAAYENIYAKSETPTSGGVREEKSQITSYDIEEGKNRIKTALKEEGRMILEEELEKEFLLRDNSQYRVVLDSEEVSHEEGDLVEEFQIKMEGRVELITFKEGDLNELLKRSLLEKAPAVEVKDEFVREMEVHLPTLSKNYQIEEFDWEAGEGSLKVEFAGEVYQGISESRLKSSIAGMSRSEAERMIGEESAIRRASIRFRPFSIFTLGNIPSQGERIRVRVEF